MANTNSCPCDQLQVSDTGILVKDGQAENVGHGQVTDNKVSSLESFLPEQPSLNHTNFNNDDIEIIQTLLTSYDDSPVILASKAGSYQLLDLLCKEVPDANTERISYALEKAAEKGRADLVDLLLKYDANVNKNYSQGKDSAVDTVLNICPIPHGLLLLERSAHIDFKKAVYSAVICQQPIYVKFLFDYYTEAFKIFCKQDTKESSMSRLIESVLTGGHLEMINIFLDAGVDVNCVLANEETPLMIAKTSEVAQLLIQRGADATAKHSKGQTALMFAVQRNSIEVVQAILKGTVLCDPMINCQSDDGKTALILAAEFCSWGIVDWLIMYGADVNICDDYGETALMKAVGRSFCKLSIVKFIIRAGANVNQQNKDGISALMMAVKNYDIGATEILLYAGADVNALDNRKYTALSILFRHILYPERLTRLVNILVGGVPTIEEGVEKLVRGGAKLPVGTLHLVILQGKPDFIPFLISSGLTPADVLASELGKQIEEYYYEKEEILNISAVLSPFCLALLKGFYTHARYFVDNWFLTPTDVSTLSINENVRKYIERKGRKSCLEYLEEFLSEPMSLCKLAFVAVSSAVGSGPGREERVTQLTVPSIIKDRLLYRKEIVPLQAPDI